MRRAIKLTKLVGPHSLGLLDVASLKSRKFDDTMDMWLYDALCVADKRARDWASPFAFFGEDK